MTRSRKLREQKELEEFWRVVGPIVESWVQERMKGETPPGLGPVIWQLERRLGRKLVANERERLVERLCYLGSDRLGDVVLDRSPAELAAWLGDPNAT